MKLALPIILLCLCASAQLPPFPPDVPAPTIFKTVSTIKGAQLQLKLMAVVPAPPAPKGFGGFEIMNYTGYEYWVQGTTNPASTNWYNIVYTNGAIWRTTATKESEFYRVMIQ